jgi:uncharacterized protein YggE
MRRIMIDTNAVTPQRLLQTPSSRGFSPLMLCVIGFLLLGIIFVGSQTLGFQANKTRTITVAGQVKKSIPVGKAQVAIQFVSQNEDRNYAVASGEKQFSDIVSQLSAISGVSIEQSAAQIIPPSGSVLSKSIYEYRKTVKITVKGVDNISQVFTLLKQQSVTVAQTSFFPDDEVQTRESLLGDAVAEAKNKALVIAKASNTHIGQVVNITESPNSQDSSNILSDKGALLNSEKPGNLELTANVNVTFALN